ncbi:hypothetical protein QU41_19755 [Bradyrhizobium elkanii]|nr:hypothetical protein QU41_19755 [Bradyrhizobium elkanii]
MNDPVRLRVHPRLALARVRVFNESLPVPDQLADIHLVVEDAVAALRVAVDGAEAPIAAARCGDAILVQLEGDPLGRFARGIVAEDTADDISLNLIDGPVATHRLAAGVELLDHIIAIGIAATGLAQLDAATLTAPRLVGEILQEQGVHRALEPDMEMRDLALG